MSYDQGEKPFLGTRMKNNIPGTAGYTATHGDAAAGGTRATGLQSHIPGTDEHRMRHRADVVGDDHRSHFPPHGSHDTAHGSHHTTASPITAGTAGGLGASGISSSATAGAGYGTGSGLTPGGHEMHQGYPTTGMGTAGVATGGTPYDSTGSGYGGGEQRESIGHKIKKALPGTHEHEEAKIEQGRI